MVDEEVEFARELVQRGLLRRQANVSTSTETEQTSSSEVERRALVPHPVLLIWVD